MSKLPIEKAADNIARLIARSGGTRPRKTLKELANDLREQIDRCIADGTIDAVKIARLSLAIDRLDKFDDRNVKRPPPRSDAQSDSEANASRSAMIAEITTRVSKLRKAGLL